MGTAWTGSGSVRLPGEHGKKHSAQDKKNRIAHRIHVRKLMISLHRMEPHRTA
jgi:hypothetical protein